MVDRRRLTFSISDKEEGDLSQSDNVKRVEEEEEEKAVRKEEELVVTQ